MNDRNFYIFKGDWYKKYLEMAGVAGIGRLAIWTPKDRSRNFHLAIVSGAELPESYCFNHNIWKTDLSVFETYYSEKIKNYNVYASCDAQRGTKAPDQEIPQRAFDFLRA